MSLYAFSGQLQQSSMQQQTLWLFSGIALVLLIATAISETLRWRARTPERGAGQPGRPHRRMVGNGRSGRHCLRLRACRRHWFVRVGVVVRVARIHHPHPQRRGDDYALLAAFYIVLPWQYGLVWAGWYGMYTLLIPVYAFLVLPILATIGGDTTRYLEHTAKV